MYDVFVVVIQHCESSTMLEGLSPIKSAWEFALGAASACLDARYSVILSFRDCAETARRPSAQLSHLRSVNFTRCSTRKCGSHTLAHTGSTRGTQFSDREN